MEELVDRRHLRGLLIGALAGEVSAKAAVDRLAAAATRPVREGGGCGAGG
ncbi:hypothetical protein BH20ACT18_BH20ACT18_12090 [soil metagenome]